MCGSFSSWGRWCACDVCDFREEMLVSLWNVGGGVERGCEEVAKRLVEFER